MKTFKYNAPESGDDNIGSNSRQTTETDGDKHDDHSDITCDAQTSDETFLRSIPDIDPSDEGRDIWKFENLNFENSNGIL